MLTSVSTSSLLATPRQSVSDLQSKLTKVEYESTSGLIADPVETLGSQIGLDESLRNQAATLTNLQSTNSIVSTQLTASQDALTNLNTDAQTFMKTLITAQSTGSVNALASQALSFLNAFTNYANTTSGGVYLFGGTNSSVAPMANYSGAPQAGTAAAFQAAFGFSQSDPQANTITSSAMQSFLSNQFAGLFADPTPGSTSNWTTWSQAASTNTSAIISPGQSVTTSVSAYSSAFRQLASAYTSIADLGIDNLNGVTQQTVISNAMQQVSTAMSGISDLQTTLGFSQSRITDANTALQTQTSTINNTIGQLDNADPYQTAENLNSLTMQLEASYNLTGRIAKLSLVNYL
jgi:flagellar hook-associated protein 3 FlgL